MADVSVLSLLGRLVFSLAVVLILMALLARVLRNRTMPGIGRAPMRRDMLQILARQQLSRSASIAVVEAAGRALIVGVTDSGINLLSEIDPESLEPAETEVDGATVGTPTAPTWSGFIEALRERSVRRG